MTKKKQTFEKSLERLEAIVSEMENGSLNLEDMIARFEEGQSLIKYCSKKLNEVERKIETIIKKGDDIIVEPFEEHGNGEPEDPNIGANESQDELF